MQEGDRMSAETTSATGQITFFMGHLPGLHAFPAIYGDLLEKPAVDWNKTTLGTDAGSVAFSSCCTTFIFVRPGFASHMLHGNIACSIQKNSTGFAINIFRY